MGRQIRAEFFPNLQAPGLEIGDALMALGNLLVGSPAVDRQLTDTGTGLLFQAADPFHEEPVQIRTCDGQKFESFQKRVARAGRFVENPFVKRKPGQLPVEKQ